jgi:hypothetical protein
MDEKFLQIIEMVLVGHGVPMTKLVNTIDLAEELLVEVRDGASVEKVGEIMTETLVGYGVEQPLTPFNAAFIHGAAEKIINA